MTDALTSAPAAEPVVVDQMQVDVIKPSQTEETVPLELFNRLKRKYQELLEVQNLILIFPASTDRKVSQTKPLFVQIGRF